jgi:hypothetical protein
MISKNAKMNPSLSAVRNKLPRRLKPDLSLFIVYVGCRGSGKTLSAVAHCCLLMAAGYQVWSNIPIQFTFKGKDGSEYLLSAKPLDLDALMTFDEGISEGIAFIDELPLWGTDNRQSLSVKNRLMNAAGTLIRKHSLSILATSQSFSWLDKRTQFQTDALCICRDLHYLSTSHKILPGEYISQSWRDQSGILTGRTFSESGKEYGQVLFGKPFWECYDSWSAFDILAAMQPTKLKLGTREIIRTDLDSQYRMQEDVKAFISENKKLGRQNVSAFEVFERFKGKNSKNVGRMLKKAGCSYRQTRKGSFYDLPEV